MEIEMTNQDHCPTCGVPVTIHQSKGGPSCYMPKDRSREDRKFIERLTNKILDKDLKIIELQRKIDQMENFHQ